MGSKKLFISVLIILLLAGVVGVSTSAPVTGCLYNDALAGTTKMQSQAPLDAQTSRMDVLSAGINDHGQSAKDISAEMPTWQQVNSSGFGDLNTGEVSALRAFNNYLYAGTSNPIDGARIFRSPDGESWTPVTDPGFALGHDTAPPSILALSVFNGRIYASTGRGDGPGQIWRALTGYYWAPMVIHGFGDPDTVDISAFADFNGYIYAGVENLISGAQIWRSFTGDSNTWTKIAPVNPGLHASRVTGLAVFGGALYGALESAGTAQIWRSYGGEWTTVVNNGFGDSFTTTTGGLAVFGGYLYVGAGNNNEGAQLWRSNNGTSWTQTITPGFGDPNNQKVEMVFVFQNQLYAGVKNAHSGMEVWRTPDGTNWEQLNQDGFGDPNNSGSNGSNAVAEYLGNLYLGTVNRVDGGEIWRMQGSVQPPVPTPAPTPSQQQLQNNIFIPVTLKLP